MAVPLPIMQKKKKKYFDNCGNPIANNVKKNKNYYFGNCGNPIADNVKKKKFILTIVAIPLPKIEKKIMKSVNE